MNKKDKALDYYDYLVKTNPNKHVELVYYIRVYDDDCVEASNHPYLLDKECVFSVAEYVLTSGSGFKTNIENVQLYFDKNGETFDFAPYRNGELIIDMRQAWAGYNGRGYYDCTYSRNGLHFEFNGAPLIDYLPFYKLFLSYVKLVDTCSSQGEVDYLEKCLKKDVTIEELNRINIAEKSRISRLEDLLETYKDLLVEIKKLVGINDAPLTDSTNN